MQISKILPSFPFVVIVLGITVAPISNVLRAQTTGASDLSAPLTRDQSVAEPSASNELERVNVIANVRAPEPEYRPLTAVWEQVNFRAEDEPMPLPILERRGETTQGEPEAKSTSETTTSAPSMAAPAPSTDFESTDFDDSGFIPADPIAAAGPHHVVNVTNGRVRFHQKNGTLNFDDRLSNFFNSLKSPNGAFDPKVIFDQVEGRFVIVALDRDDDGSGGAEETSTIFVAVSDDSDPNGTWIFTAIDSKINIDGTDHWADYPGLAVDQNAVYITNNMFEFSPSFDFGGVRLWVIDKGIGTGGIYESGPASVALFDPYAGGGLEATTQPSHMFGSAPADVGTFLVSYSGISDGTNEALQVVRLDDPLGAAVFSQQLVGIGDIEDFTSFPTAPQKDSTIGIETNDRRALDAVWFDDALWTTATIVPKSGDPDADEATAHWWKLDTSTLGSLFVSDQGNIGGEDIATGAHTFFPSVAVNGAGQTVFGFSASAPTIYAGSYYTTRQTGDPPGSNNGSATLRAGADYYERTFCSGRNRWGDYSGAAVDPVDGGFWVYNKHAMARGSVTDPCGNSREDGRWSTAYANFTPLPACPADMFLAFEDFSLIGVVKEAASAIRTGNALTVSATGDVTFRAGELVVLKAGFSVKQGGVFSVEMSDNPCLL